MLRGNQNHSNILKTRKYTKQLETEALSVLSYDTVWHLHASSSLCRCWCAIRAVLVQFSETCKGLFVTAYSNLQCKDSSIPSIAKLLSNS